MHLGVVLALALSAGGPATPELADMSRGALAPAPGKVLLQTRSFGAVTLDHPAHLARKIACKQCHGPGPVRKPEFTPRTAHETCVTCHREREHGPTKCRDCHIVPSQGDAPVQVAAGEVAGKQLAKDAGQAGATGAPRADGAPRALVASAGVSASTGASASPGPSAIAGASSTSSAPVGAAAPAAPASFVDEAPAPSHTEFVRAVSVGYSGLHSSGNYTTGIALVLTAREDNFLLLQSVERTIGGIGDAGGRTLGLAGAGVVIPLRGRFNLLATGVGGVDAPEKPSASILPAAGVRLGVEWLGRQSCVSLWATGLTDLVRSVDPVTRESIGGTTFSLAMTAGFILDHR